MKKLFYLLSAGLILLSACQKDNNDLNVTLKNSGKLKVRLASTDGKAIADTKLQLYLYYSSNSTFGSSFDSKKTNSNGEADFGKLIESIYTLYAKDVKVGNKKFNIYKPIMVTSGLEDVITVNPEEFVGKLTLNVCKYTSNMGYNQKAANVNVALIPYTDYKDTLSHAAKLSLALADGTTDSQGKVVFDKVPSNYEYLAYIYLNSDKNTLASNNYNLYVNRDDEKEVTVSFNDNDLQNIKINYALHFQYYDMNWNIKSISGLNVIVVKYNDYYTYDLNYSDISTIQSFKVASGITNSYGDLTLQLRTNKEYQVFVYFNETYKTWPTSIYTSNTDSNRDIYVERTYLGLSK